MFPNVFLILLIVAMTDFKHTWENLTLYIEMYTEYQLSLNELIQTVCDQNISYR